MKDEPQRRTNVWRSWRFWLSGVGGGLCLVVTALMVAGCMFSAPAYEGPVTDHFDGETFRNQDPFQRKSFADVMRWRWTSEPVPWPDRRGNEPGPPPPERVTGDRVRVTFVNHATVLVQVAGLNLLTDPVWAERVSPVSWAGPKRAIDPGIRFEHLPPIDAVVISHNHYDHLDLETLRRLAAEHAPTIFVPLGNNLLLEEEGIPGGVDLDWWESRELGDGLRMTLVPAQHWSGRGTRDRFKTLWGGYVLETPAGVIYYAGDSGYGRFFQQVRERFGPPRLAMIPIGAYEPRWFMKDSHMNPAEAVQGHLDVAAGVSLGVHFGTWQLTDEGIDDPIRDLDTALAEQDLDRDTFWVLQPGAGRDVPSL